MSAGATILHHCHRLHTGLRKKKRDWMTLTPPRHGRRRPPPSPYGRLCGWAEATSIPHRLRMCMQRRLGSPMHHSRTSLPFPASPSPRHHRAHRGCCHTPSRVRVRALGLSRARVMGNPSRSAKRTAQRPYMGRWFWPIRPGGDGIRPTLALLHKSPSTFFAIKCKSLVY